MEQTEVVEKTVAFTFPLDVRKSGEQAGEFHVIGYAATSDFDQQGDILAPEALEAAAQDLIKNSTVLLNHDLKLPIGRVVSVKFDKRGLLIDALISATEPEIIAKIKEGVLNKFSIRGQVLERERKFSKEQDRVVNIIKRVSLVEVSLVSVPANPEARAIGWYISKALDEEGSEGGNDMNEVIVESISAEGGAGAGSPAPSPQSADQPALAKDQGTPKPPEQPQAAPAAQAAQPAAQVKPPEAAVQEEVTKALTAKMAAMLEPVLLLMDRLSGQLGEDAKPLAHQIKALLLGLAGKPLGSPIPPAAGGISKADLAAVVSAEVQKQLKKTLDEIPTLRKGLVSQEGAGAQQPGGQNDTEQVMKAFSQLDPSDKLRTLLKVEHGRKA